MAHNVPLSKDNIIYAFSKLNFTKDYSRVVEGSVLINRNGESSLVTKIDLDEFGRRRIWNGDNVLCIQHEISQSLNSKPAYYAYEFEVHSKDVNISEG